MQCHICSADSAKTQDYAFWGMKKNDPMNDLAVKHLQFCDSCIDGRLKTRTRNFWINAAKVLGTIYLVLVLVIFVAMHLDPPPKAENEGLVQVAITIVFVFYIAFFFVGIFTLVPAVLSVKILARRYTIYVMAREALALKGDELLWDTHAAALQEKPPSPAIVGAKCGNCGKQVPGARAKGTCPHCGAFWMYEDFKNH